MSSDSPVTPTPDRPDEPVWGKPRSWSTRQTLAAVGIAAVIAALGGAAIYAASGGESHAMGPGQHGTGPGRWVPGGPGGPGGPGQGPAAALHGEFVVSDGNGGYTTEGTQTGVLTAVSDTSITAKSADGFTQTYTLAPDSRAADTQLAVNDTVTIRATKANGAATATMVSEGDAPGPGGPGGPPQMGAPPR